MIVGFSNILLRSFYCILHCVDSEKMPLWMHGGKRANNLVLFFFFKQKLIFFCDSWYFYKKEFWFYGPIKVSLRVSETYRLHSENHYPNFNHLMTLRCALSNKVSNSHVWLFKCKLIKTELLNIQLLFLISHLSSAQ